MRTSALAVAMLVATGCAARHTSSRTVPASRISASLQISVSIGRTEAPTRMWTLRCPAGGTLPDPARACRLLAAIAKPFAPVPKNVACTEIYGGPQVAEVGGTFRGRKVNARFTRTEGCQIARWNRVRFLFPGV